MVQHAVILQNLPALTLTKVSSVFFVFFFWFVCLNLQMVLYQVMDSVVRASLKTQGCHQACQRMCVHFSKAHRSMHRCTHMHYTRMYR